MPVKRIITGQKIAPDKLLRAKEFRRSMTPAEALLWKELRANRLGGFHFRRQQIILGFIVDFYCHVAALVVEVDGDVHRSQAAYDAEREAVLRRAGLRVLRLSNAEVTGNLKLVLQRILTLCEEHSP